MSSAPHYDLIGGFRSNSSSYLISFGDDNDSDQTCELVMQNVVLKGRAIKVEVQSQRKEFHNLSTILNNQKTKQGLA